MRPFADYVISFNQSVRDMRKEGIGLRMNRTFAYKDSGKSDRDIQAEPSFVRVKRPETLTFREHSVDHNYAEPLIRSITKTLQEIESLQNERLILPLHEKLLFIITDAGANDVTDEALSNIVKKSQDLNLSVYFVYPSSHGVLRPSSNLDDTPRDAYINLEDIIAYFEGSNAETKDIIFRKFKFKAEITSFFSSLL